MSLSLQQSRAKILLYQFRDKHDHAEMEKLMFARSLGIAPEQLHCVDVLVSAPSTNDLLGANGIVLAGSEKNIGDNLPNQPALLAVLRAGREKKIPMFGCCFGGQVVAHAFGGEVRRDDAHSEFGTFVMQATDDTIDDILFVDAPSEFFAQCAHYEYISKLPLGGVVLATSARCPVEAFTIVGTGIYGTQFHPERTKADTEKFLALWKNELSSDIVASMTATLRDTPEAESLLKKFVDRIVLTRQK